MSSILNPSQPDQLRKETKPTAIHGLDSGFEPNQLGWSTLTESLQWEVPLLPASQPSTSVVTTETVAGTHMAMVGYLLLFICLFKDALLMCTSQAQVSMCA